MNNPPVIDVCCGSRAFWFDRKDERVLFTDVRSETVQADKRKGRKPIVIAPDMLADFQELPYPDNSFSLVVFDPPHVKFGSTSCLAGYYGSLEDNWREVFKKGFAECFRVLRPEGVLIFKWNEVQHSINEVLKLTPNKPLFGHKTGRASKTHWVTFMKGSA